MAGLHGIGGAEPEIGIWIKEAAHGAGYGREAVATTIAWACRWVGATAFTYPVAVENLPSRRLAESIGGKITGTGKLRKPSGVVLDQVVYRIEGSFVRVSHRKNRCKNRRTLSHEEICL
jgi:RimJ/RimL family protein N-acetyltransferase